MQMKLLAAAALLALGMQTAGAAVTANYKLAAPEATGDEDIIGPFDTYDAGQGVALVKPFSGSGSIIFPQVGDVVDVFYQAHLQGHQLNGVTLLPTGLNSTYEITIVAQFKEVVTSAIPNGGSLSVNSAVIAGSGLAQVYMDTTPDYNYVGDSGFTNGQLILTGSIQAGLGTLTNIGIGAVGFEALTYIAITSFDANVFDPDLVYADGIFTLSTFGTSTAGVGSVLGNAIGGGLLISSDGNITLTAVPLPAAAYLLGSALVGLTSIRRRVTG